MKKEITAEDLQRFEAQFDESRVNRVAMNAAAQAGVLGASRNYAVEQNNPFCSMTNWRRPTISWRTCWRRWMSRRTAAW